MTSWRLLFVPPRFGAENMARDAGLMDRARSSGETIFSVYAWGRPTLSLGRNQTARGRYDLDEISRRGIDVVRRPTGGRALLHHREVTYSVAAPLDDTGSLVEVYHRINAILLQGLRAIGVNAAESSGDMAMPRPGTLPCFASPAPGELVTNGAKLVGSAQVRENGALLQHGSILIDDDQPVISELLLANESDMPVSAAATVRGAIGRAPAAEEIASALFNAVMILEDPGASRIGEAETRDLTSSHLEKYRSDWWTWRR